MDLISTKELKRALVIRQKIEALEMKLGTLIGGTRKVSSVRKRPGKVSAARRRKMPVAVKAKLAAIARARWRKAKAAGKTRL